MLTVQNLCLLIGAFAWLWFEPRPELFASIRFDDSLLYAVPLAVLMLLLSTLGILTIPALQRAHLYLDHLLFKHFQSSDAIYIGVVAGVAEEFVFRGLLQSAWGLIPASLCFGFMHLPALRHYSFAIWATLMGLLLGVVYQFTGNLLLVMLAHILNNSFALWIWPRFRARLMKRTKDAYHGQP